MELGFIFISYFSHQTCEMELSSPNFAYFGLIPFPFPLSKYGRNGKHMKVICRLLISTYEIVYWHKVSRGQQQWWVSRQLNSLHMRLTLSYRCMPTLLIRMGPIVKRQPRHSQSLQIFQDKDADCTRAHLICFT